MTTMNHTRSFGCEIELVGLNIEQAATAMRNAGIVTYDTATRRLGPSPDSTPEITGTVEGPVLNASCNCDECYRERQQELSRAPRPSEDAIRAVWRVVPDGSVSDGCEVVSPVLSGNEGLQTLRTVVRALKSAGAEVNNSCGFHVHVDARDLKGAEVCNAVMRYARFETDIDGFMAPRRREGRSQWCASMATLAQTLRDAGEISSINQVMNLQRSRYLKLNIHAYLKHGTLEFRQHAGTMNINKMVNWIIFCVNFVENSRLSEEFLATYDAAAKERQIIKLAGMLAANSNRWNLYADAVAREIGVSEEMLPEVFAKLVNKYPVYNGVRVVDGLVRAPRVNGTYRPEVPATATTLPDGPGMFDNVPEATVTYLQRRAAGYASRGRRALSREARLSRDGVGF